MTHLLLGEEARVALKPPVALESALISHGLPYPKNVEAAQAMEEILREGGAAGGMGGTTVSATLYLAHRGRHWDVSANLFALAETPLVVVCSGAKAILDLPATLEWLETSGGPVIGYGTGEFPAFYARDELGLSTAILVVVPVPEKDEVPRSLVEEALARALEMVEVQGVRGGALTPFLLGQLNELTQGATLGANIALLKNNARMAAGVAQASAMP